MRTAEDQQKDNITWLVADSNFDIRIPVFRLAFVLFTAIPFILLTPQRVARVKMPFRHQ